MYTNRKASKHGTFSSSTPYSNCPFFPICRVFDLTCLVKGATQLRESTGETRKEFSIHTGIPVRTLEDWEAGRRTPPEYIPRLIAYQLEYEKIMKDRGEFNGKE